MRIPAARLIRSSELSAQVTSGGKLKLSVTDFAQNLRKLEEIARTYANKGRAREMRHT
jgi:hypothetical protein